MFARENFGKDRVRDLFLFDIDEKKFTLLQNLAPDLYRGKIQKDSKGTVVNFYAFTPGKPELLKISNPQLPSAKRKLFFTNRKENIVAIIPSQDSLIWIATNKGLSKFNPLSQNYVLFNQFNQNKIENILGIAEYNLESLAISTSNGGLIFFNKKTLQFEKPKGFLKTHPYRNLS